jgi:hypothetical protein
LNFSHCIFDFSNTLLHVGIFLAFFLFLQKDLKNISKYKNPLKNLFELLLGAKCGWAPKHQSKRAVGG